MKTEPDSHWRLLVDRGPKSAYHQYMSSDQDLINTYLRDTPVLSDISDDLKTSNIPTLKINDRGVSVSLKSLSKEFVLHFTQGEINRRVYQRAETLCRVTGAHRGQALTILDATAGLGREAYLMASSGAQVFAFERTLPLYLLTRDALTRSPQQFHLSLGDSVQGWSQIKTDADVIYLDPMFPTKTKRAAVGREAQVLQAFAAPDSPQDDQLLTWALDTALRRVVVKRPIKAPPLAGPHPTSAVKGRAVRFDIYGKRKLP